jgi:hypothetical protein
MKIIGLNGTAIDEGTRHDSEEQQLRITVDMNSVIFLKRIIDDLTARINKNEGKLEILEEEVQWLRGAGEVRVAAKR